MNIEYSGYKEGVGHFSFQIPVDEDKVNYVIFMHSHTQVLKPEWRGKGIDLIAPFTQPIGNRSYTLTWHAIKQFDMQMYW